MARSARSRSSGCTSVAPTNPSRPCSTRPSRNRSCRKASPARATARASSSDSDRIHARLLSDHDERTQSSDLLPLVHQRLRRLLEHAGLPLAQAEVVGQVGSQPGDGRVIVGSPSIATTSASSAVPYSSRTCCRLCSSEIDVNRPVTEPYAPVLHVGAVGDEGECARHQEVPLPPRGTPVAGERHHDHRLGQQEEGGDDAEQHHRRAAPVHRPVPRRRDQVRARSPRPPGSRVAPWPRSRRAWRRAAGARGATRFPRPRAGPGRRSATRPAGP